MSENKDLEEKLAEIEKYIYDDFEKDLLLLQNEANERFKGGVTTIFEVNAIEQSITRFNIICIFIT